MRLSILFRTHAGGNAKARPPWYDRAGGLSSLRTALAQVADAGVEVELTFVVDGSWPSELEGCATPTDRVVHVSGGSASSSFRACVEVALDLARTDPPDTLYWLAEDDYLYRPASLRHLVAGASALAAVSYFTLYVPDDSAWHATHPSQPARPVEQGSPVTVDDGPTWRRVAQTTSTFGVRRDALLRDAGLLRLGSTVGAPFDAATWVALRGERPFSWRHLASDLDGYLGVRGVVKTVAKPVMRVVLNLVVLLARRPRRELAAPAVDLAMHLEVAMIPPDGGWAELAAAQ